jgi:tetratricopeptide (TPR) repeat protein
MALAGLLEKLAGAPAKGRFVWRPAAVTVGVLAVAVVLTLGTRRYLHEWQTTERHEFYMLRLAPDSPYAQVNCGIVLKNKGEYVQSFTHYKKAIELKPDYAEAYNNRGNASMELNSLSEAIHDYTKAIDLQPDYTGAYYNRANAYRARGDYWAAISDNTMAIKLNPGFMAAYNNRAIAYFYLKEYDNAWADVKVVKRLGGQPTPDLIRALTEATGRSQ